MSQRMLPASPNWYCSRCSDLNEAGVFAFAAKSNVFIFHVSSIDASLSYKGVYKEHRERVSALSLCPGTKNPGLCCSGSDDGCVMLWDVDSRNITADHRKHGSKVTGISWSPVDPQCIVSGDDQGSVVVWNREAERSDVFTPEKNGTIFCVACSSQDANIAAIGYQNGLILLVDVEDKGRVVHRLRGHDEEVHSLTWSTLPGEAKPGHDTDEIEATSGCFLASGSKDQSVILWSTFRGKSLCRLKLPVNSRVKRDKYDPQNKARVWVAVQWLPGRRYQLVSSSFNGELLLWDLSLQTKDKHRLFLPGAAYAHARIVFNLSIGCYGNTTLVSTSLDRQVVLWDIDSLQPLSSLPTVGGFVYSIASSPLDPGRLAIGGGDNMIRVWNTGNHGNKYDVTSFWQGIRSKVLALSWHPRKENWLAFGTDDGRVGIYDVLSNKAPILTTTYHRWSVYVMTWGPTPGARDESLSLYSVGDGVIYAFNPHDMAADPLKVNDHIAAANNSQETPPTRSELSWREDYSAVAIGNDNGSVEVYDGTNWHLLVVVRVLSKLINVIRWHPPSTVVSPVSSEYRHWVAIGSNECVVQVVDLSRVLGTLAAKNGDTTEPGVTPMVSESSRSLVGHGNRITGLAWSPHHDARLVSVSFDGFAQVWDVSTGHPVATFSGHQHSRIFCVHWSYLDDDMILSGAEDHCLHEWRVSAHEGATFTEGKKKKKKGKGSCKPKMAIVSPAVDDATSAQLISSNVRSVVSEKPPEGRNYHDNIAAPVEKREDQRDSVMSDLMAQLETKRRALLIEAEGKAKVEQTTLHHVSTATQTTHIDAEELKEITKRRRKCTKSMFPMFGEVNNRDRNAILDDVITLATMIYDNKTDVSEGNLHLGIYLSRRSAFRFMKQEEDYHLDNGNMDYYLQMEVWKGNIAGAIKFAKDNDQLSDWLVAITPLVSRGLWQQVTYDYARQLEADGQYHKSAIYFLAVERVYDAIDMFTRHRLFKEAILLAKVRLSPFDPVLEELYLAWAQKLTKDGQFEQATKCYLSIKRSKDASRLLAQRSDEMSLRTAAYVSFIARETREGWIYAQKLVSGYLTGGEWGKVHAMVTQQANMQMFGLLACVHELWVKELQQLTPQYTLVPDTAEFTKWGTPVNNTHLPEFILDEGANDRLCIWPARLVGEHSLAHCIVRIWYQQLNVPMDTTAMRSMYDALGEIRRTRQTQLHLQQILVHSAYDLVLCLLALLLSETTAAITHMNNLIRDLRDLTRSDLIVAVCRLLLPQGPGYMLRLQHEITALRVIINMESNGGTYDQLSCPNLTTKFWSVPKDGVDISNSNARCKDLDCLRVYYYLMVLQYVQEVSGQSLTGNNMLLEHSKSANPSNDCSRSEKLVRVNPRVGSDSVEKAECNGTGDKEALQNVDGVKNVINKSIPDVIRDIEQKGDVESKDCDIRVDNGVENNVKVSKPRIPDSMLDKITLCSLCHISRCVLWDVQARHAALKETLGYVHKALSLIMLDQPRSTGRMIDSAATAIKVDDDSSSGEMLTCNGDKSSEHQTDGSNDIGERRDIFNLCEYKPQNEFQKTDGAVLSQRKPRVNKPSITFDQNSIENVTQQSQFPAISSCSRRQRHILWNDEHHASDIADQTCVRDYPDIPANWMDVAIEDRYVQPYMTLAILQQEEEFVNGELRNGLDFIQVDFPSALDSCRRLIEVTSLLPHISENERNAFVDKLCTWALQFAVTSNDIAYFTETQSSVA